MIEEKKPAHSIVLDAGPLIANTPSISTLLNKSEEIFTTPSVINEIKDAAARSRLETLVLPFISLRTPSIESMKFVTEFARKSGDFAVLSKTDLEVVALAYELECERNGGDWRLRKTPGQKTVNGSPPTKDTSQNEDTHVAQGQGSSTSTILQPTTTESTNLTVTRNLENLSVEETSPSSGLESKSGPTAFSPKTSENEDPISAATEELSSPKEAPTIDAGSQSGQSHTDTRSDPLIESHNPMQPESDSSSESNADSDGGEWITPSNINRHKTSIAASSKNEPAQPKTLQVATITSDYALQNTLLLINLNLLSSSLTRIHQVKSHILRCHACFATTKHMEKQFCPRCGQPTLTRVTISTSANGRTQMHLKKNMQWNTRGNRYSIPKPVAGTANGKMREKGGGKGGWGKDLILAEDQKEYVRAVQEKDRQKRRGERDVLDQDFLPAFLSSDRGQGAGGRIQVGAGRNVNARKRN